jgi:hypothetical protein
LWARPQKIHGNPKNQGCSPWRGVQLCRILLA